MGVSQLLNVLVVIICIISLHLTCGKTTTNPIKCKDSSGSDIDWFIAYKLPKIKESSNPLVRQGFGLAYILPGSTDWQISSQGVNDSKSLVGQTLQPLFQVQDSTSIAFILYNDQSPIGPTIMNNGHTKGIILTNSDGGIWLQHSVPHFLLLDSHNIHYTYPTTGTNNGQILHCMSLSIKEVDNVGNILELTKPNPYNYSIPEGLTNFLPTLNKIIKHPHPYHHNYDQAKGDGQAHEFNPTPTSQVQQGQDMNHNVIQVQNAGRTLNSFAKGPSFNEEIYSDWIAPMYKSDLDVQSWLNGPHAYHSNCTSTNLNVYNINETQVSGSKFSTHNDHSKWAIGIQQPVVCIGDLNRMEHQEKRGGTVNCFMDEIVWKAFKKLVLSTQPCSKPLLGAQQSFFSSLRKRVMSFYRSLFSG